MWDVWCPWCLSVIHTASMASIVSGVLCLCNVLPSVGGACVVSALYSAPATLRGAARISCLSASDSMLRHGRPSRHTDEATSAENVKTRTRPQCESVHIYVCAFYMQSRERATHRHTHAYAYALHAHTETETETETQTRTHTHAHAHACTHIKANLY